MKKNYKRFLSLLLSIVMVIGMLPIGALAAGQLDLGLKVIARYMTNRLTWQGESGVTYHVERSANNQQWEEIGTSDTGSYLDTGAGLGTQYYYRLTTEDANTEGVQGNVTGMAALQAIAVLFYEGDDDTIFDGTNREIIAEGEDATKLNALESGTIVYKATMNDVTTEQGVLGTDNNCYVGVRNSKFRHDLGGGFKGDATTASMAAGANTAGFVYDDSNGHWGLCANGANVTSIDLDESRFGMLTGAGATTYYAGGSPSYPLNGTINYIMVLSEVLTDAELKALTAANLDFDAADTIDVAVYIDREKTVVVNGSVTPDTEEVKNIAQVTYASKTMSQTGLDNTFSGNYVALADCEYTFDKQDDGTWLICAEVDGTTVYVDPHAGASNGGYPNRTYQTNIKLLSGTNGAFKFYQQDEGYLHFWDNDDSKLYWDQCTNDSGHTGHNLLVYRQATQDEESSTEVPGYVQVTDADTITDGSKYLIVMKTNSGGYYAMKPCKTTSNKYQHLCKIAGVVTELTIHGTAKGTGTIYAGKYSINVQVLERENLEISLNYNYDGAPANGTLTVVSGDPIGELPVPMRQDHTFFGWYLNGEKVTSASVFTESVTLNADWINVTKKDKPANGTATGSRPFPETYANGDPYNYRIPGIVTMADGTVVAMADARWNTSADCSAHDTIVSVSKDNGKTWEYTYANYLGDSNDVRDIWASMFIDPAIATDGETLYMIADLFPAGVSTQAAALRSQSGSNGFNTEGKLMLRDLAGDTHKLRESGYLSMATSRSYDFYLDPSDDGYTIRRKSDDSAVEGYTVDKMFNISSADGTINTHLFMADSPFQVYPTNYLYLTKSTDGLNWSEPELITAKNADESAFLIGPGSGTYDADSGRMIFTAYCHGGSLGERTCLLWAGEDGVWHRSEDVGFGSSEASAVVLNNGTVRVFYRTGGVDLRYTDYKWNGSEYIRDTNNTDVDTGVDRKNTCMLTAFKYPEKVNNREMILVAAPNAAIAGTYNRRDGQIHAFYVNKDGSMEHVTTYNVTPDDNNEWYGYSCLTVLTQGEEKGDLALFWEDAHTDGSYPACTIKYSVIAMEDFLTGVKEVVYKDVPLIIGKTATFEDTEGYYVGVDTSDLNTDVATVDITGTVTDTITAAGDAVSTIEDGTYVIVNTRAGKPMTNGSASANGGNGLSLTGTKNNVTESSFWTIKAANGGYTVQDADGKYLTIGSNTAGVTEAETVVSIARNGDNWTISQNNAYLNNFGGGGTCAAGWQNASAANDVGSQWTIHILAEVPVAGTSEITFTGEGVGATELQIGYVVYRITVTECPHTNTEIRDAEEATCTDPGYTGDTWCLDCEKKIATGEATPAGHKYENGICSACGEKDPNAPTEPEVTEPKPTEPKPTEPEVTEPKPTEPKPTEPEVTEPKPTEPDPTEPEAPKVEGVTRLAGENRLITSYLVADQLKAKMGVEKFQNIIVASGATFADALPGSYLSAVKNAPIVLTLEKQKYIDQTADYIKANLAEGGTVYILGGESAVPKTMETALAGLKVQRVAGADRFGTNLEILKVAGVKPGDEILVCEGKGYADSLSASATGKPILLVYKKITDEQKTYLATLTGCNFTVVGGTTAVPDSIAKEMETYGTVTRLAGKDRLDTSILVAQKYFPNATTSVVAYGWDFPDGLCGGSLAYATKSPLILAHSKEKLFKFTADYTVEAGLKAGYVLGGDKLVDDAATRAIFGMDSESITVLK